MINSLKIKYFIIFSLLMIQSFVSGSVLSTFLVYLIILTLLASICVSFNGYLRGKYKFKLSNVDLLVGLFIIALLRSYFNETLNFTAVLLYLIVLILFSTIIRFDVQKNSFWKSFIGSLVLILVVNILLFVIGINNSFWSEIGVTQLSRSPQKLRLLSYFNIDLDRTGFLIFNSFAYYSMLLGLLIISIFHKFIKLNKFILLLLLFLAFFSILLLDARGPVLFVVIVVIFSKVISIINKNNFFIVFIMITVIPILYSGLMLYLGFSDSESSMILSSRDLIWSSFFINYNPNFFALLFGYGFLGQSVSEISSQYEYLFMDRGDSSLIISLHNNYLQYLIDVGLVGIFILYKIVQKTFMKIDKLDLQIFKPIILYLLLVGTLEMGIIINNFICFYFFIALVYYVDYKYYKLNSFQNIQNTTNIKQ